MSFTFDDITIGLISGNGGFRRHYRSHNDRSAHGF